MLMNGHYRAETRGGAAGERRGGGGDVGLKGVLVEEGGQVGTRGAAAGGGESRGGGFNFHLGVL